VKLPLTVYLAGPIDATTQEEALGWRTVVANILTPQGFACFNPFSAFHLSKKFLQQAGPYVTLINESALRASTYVLVNLASDARTIGTIRELDLAVRLGKRVVVVLPGGVSHLSLYDVHVVDTLSEATAWICERSKE
jgi:nucleoside 2-deoxyribosyltransferase